MLNITNITYFE